MPISSEDQARTYALGAVSRLTGLTPEVLRAWEKRYGVVTPMRTPGGSRRYRAQDLERLRLLKAAVDAGHRIGRVAHLDAAELERLGQAELRQVAGPDLDDVLAALDALDASGAQRLLAYYLTILGPAVFAREVAAPLAHAIGARWATGSLSIASEHLATHLLRSLLSAAMQPTVSSSRGAVVLLATPSGEPHELGLQLAALTALGAGANPLYLGTSLPAGELVDAARRSGARVLALSIVTLDPAAALSELVAVRSALDAQVRIWIGGRGASSLAADLAPGIEVIDDLELLERRIARLSFEE